MPSPVAMLLETRAAASADAASGARPLANPCPARDPEDGRCYPSADAADLAWLQRSTNPKTLAASGADVPEEDPDDPESPDDAADAPGSKPSMSPARLAFWKNLARTVTGLVVRKTNNNPVSVPEAELAGLFAADFPLPLEAFDRAKFRDTFLSGRGRHKKHHAIDLPATRGTPVVAVADGTIERLGRDKRGGKVVYLRDTSGKYTFFYAHLARHEKGLKAGDHVVKGQRLGEVGATGHVIGGPHLHFAIFRDEDAAGRALVVNPYLVFSPILTSP
ncbi:MAG TPA: M23 family metallopeptidase [Thermoanaerobaculia bacterium]|nr:M23 family metallopeptidase [Thermoanaerobaculia bacterium]